MSALSYFPFGFLFRFIFIHIRTRYCMIPDSILSGGCLLVLEVLEISVAVVVVIDGAFVRKK